MRAGVKSWYRWRMLPSAGATAALGFDTMSPSLSKDESNSGSNWRFARGSADPEYTTRRLDVWPASFLRAAVISSSEKCHSNTYVRCGHRRTMLRHDSLAVSGGALERRHRHRQHMFLSLFQGPFSGFRIHLQQYRSTSGHHFAQEMMRGPNVPLHVRKLSRRRCILDRSCKATGWL